MFFVRGLSSDGNEVFINPVQGLYICQAAWSRTKAALIPTHRKHPVVDQDPLKIRQGTEDYLIEK